MKHFLLLTSLLLCLGIDIRAQGYTPADTVLAHQYYETGDSLLETENYEEAIVYFEIALPIYEKTENWERYVSCLNKFSESKRRNGDLDQALNLAQEALNESIEKLGAGNVQEAVAYHNAGTTYVKLKEYNIALGYLNYAMVLKLNIVNNNVKLYNTYAALAYLYYKKSDFSTSMKYYQIVFKLLENKKHFGRPWISALNIVGALHEKKGEYRKSLEYYLKSIESCGECRLLTQLLMNIGNSYDLAGNYEKSMDYYSKALKSTAGIKGRKRRLKELGAIYLNMGVSYMDQGNHDLALEYYFKSLKLKKENDLFISWTNYTNIGAAYLWEGMFEKADYYYQLGLETQLVISRNKNSGLAQVYNRVARNSRIQKRYEEALVYYQKALIANVLTFEDSSIYANPVLSEDFLNAKRLLLTFTERGMAFRGLYTEKNNLKDLGASLENYQLSDTIIDQMRRSHRNYSDKVHMSKSAKDTYQGAIETSLELFKVTHDSSYHELAFYFSEKSRAGTLQESFSTQEAKNFGGLPDSLTDMERELKIDQSYYQSRLTDEKTSQDVDSIKVSEYQNKLFAVNRSADSLVEVFERDYPKYHELKYQNKTMSISEAQANLDEQTTLLEYFNADSVLYVFTLTNQDYAITAIKEIDSLQSTIAHFRTSILEKDQKNFNEDGYQLYQTLIAPVAEKLEGEHLIIIPDGELWNVNFDLLLTDSEAEFNPLKSPYLMRKYHISYANSATLLFREQESAQRKLKQECLAFSFNDSSHMEEGEYLAMNVVRDSKEDLPGTREEILNIADIWDGLYYFGSLASERNFKEQAGDYSILHLALHGELDDKHPENSRLYFTQNQDSLEDNYLYGHELFALDLPAELAVLSACNTGAGKLARGEGVMSLGRAFQYAGTKSLLLGGWEVVDATSPVIMKYFYAGLKEGKSKSKALRDAKLQFLENDADYAIAHPYNWASFYILGDDGAIGYEEDGDWWVVLLISVCFGMLVWNGIRKR